MYDRRRALLRAVECDLALQQGPRRRAHTRHQQRQFFPSRFLRVIRFLDRPGPTFHHGKYVKKVLHAEMYAFFRMPFTDAFGIISSATLESSFGVDEVAVDVAGALFHFHSSAIRR